MKSESNKKTLPDQSGETLFENDIAPSFAKSSPPSTVRWLAAYDCVGGTKAIDTSVQTIGDINGDDAVDCHAADTLKNAKWVRSFGAVWSITE